MGEAESDAGRQRAAMPAPPDGQEQGLFMEGPPMLVEAKLGLLRPGRLHTGRRCLVFVLLTWVPLCLLTAIDGTLWPQARGIAFLADMGAFARSWVAGPLLLLADAVAGRELSRVAGRFAWMCELSPAAREGFLRVTESTRRLRDGPLLEWAVAATVLALVTGILRGLPFAQLPLWLRNPADPLHLSAAGWWYTLVSLPLLLVLIVGWLWRLVLWTRFLLLVARLDLAIVPEHPDESGGLGFVGYSLRGFALVAMAFGAIVAGSMANQVLHNGLAFLSLKYFMLGTAAACVVLFCAPLLAFAPRLARERRTGMRHFSELATSFGLRFGDEWFTGRRVEPDALQRQDFSAATDLYQVVDRVKAMRFVPLDRVNVGMIAIATLLPFVPVALLAVPFEQLVKLVIGVLV